MATQATSILANVVASKYTGKDVALFLNGASELIALMEKGQKVAITGEDYLYVPFQNQMNEAVIHTIETDGSSVGGYPTALSPVYQKFRLGYKKMLGKFQLTHEMIDINKKGEKVFVDSMKRSMNQMLKVLRLDLNAAAHLSGTGKLATAVSYADQVVTVDTTRYMRKGMVLDGYDSSDNMNANGIVVSSIDSTTTFTCTGDLTGVTQGEGAVDSGTVFYKEGSWVTGLNYAPNGISNIVDDDTGTFQNISRNTNPWIKAVIRDGSTPATNEALTLTRVRQLLDDMDNGYNGEVPANAYFYGHTGAVNAFRDLLADENVPNVTIPSKAGDAQYPTYQHGDQAIKLIGSQKALDNTLFLLNSKHLFKYFKGGQWVRHDGSLLKEDSTYPLVWGAYEWWGNFFTDFPQTLGRLNDITHG